MGQSIEGGQAVLTLLSIERLCCFGAKWVRLMSAAANVDLAILRSQAKTARKHGWNLQSPLQVGPDLLIAELRTYGTALETSPTISRGAPGASSGGVPIPPTIDLQANSKHDSAPPNPEWVTCTLPSQDRPWSDQ